MDPNQKQGNDKPNPYFQQDVVKPAAAAAPKTSAEIGDTSEAFTEELKDSRHWWQKLGRKQWIIIGAASGAVLLIGGATVALLSRDTPQKNTNQAKSTSKPSGPAPIVSALTGNPVKVEERQRPVTAVMVENSPNARPQSGLKEAGIIYEAIAEYGITRFMGLYQEALPGNIGPIRSARLYYVNWAQGYDASYAHVGGSPEALNFIRGNNIKDLDQSFNASYYQRVASRPAPHNVYTSMNRLNELEQARGWFKEPNFTGFSRKKAAPNAAPNAGSIDIAISSAAYNVHYDYDKATNRYNRVMGGAPHTDAESKAQLTPDTVVTLTVPYSLQADGYHSNYAVVGTGQAFVFQDGMVTPATWSKASNTDSLALKDDKGKDIQLNPGQTWITAVGSQNAVTYR